MGAKTILAGSIALNAALVAVALWPRNQKPPAPDPATPPPTVLSEESRAEPRTAPLVAITRDFHWSQVESSDFRQYMANLRAIACPEETIRDLVIAEVNKLYAPKFAALMAQAQHYDFWKPASRKAREGLAKQLDFLRAEKRDLLKTLLQIESDPNEQWANITVDELVAQGRFAFLSAEKQKLVREILARYEPGPDTDPKRAREKRREELAQVLSPEELYEFDLRDSNAAESVRSRFGSADLTEAEYKKLFDLRKAYEDAVGAVADVSDPEKVRKRGEARQALEEAYKSALGDQRLEEVARQQDPGWRSLTQVGQQFNLDQQTLERAYGLQQAAGEQLSKLFGDSNLSRDERRRLVDTINAELQQGLAGVMGADAAAQLQKTGPQVSFSRGGDAFTISTVPRAPMPSGSTMIIQQVQQVR